MLQQWQEPGEEMQLPQEQKVHIKNCFDIEIALIQAIHGELGAVEG